MYRIILNFHGVGPIPRPMDAGERACWLEQSFFEEVLDLAKVHPTVELTVDDGNESDYDLILPALLKRSLRATFFICAERLDQPTFLKSAQLLELLAHGMEIGCHGIAHRSWRELPEHELNLEIASSRSQLEHICHVGIESAACPFGAYDRRVLSVLRKSGYRRIYTSDGGYSNDISWIQPRLTIRNNTSLKTLSNTLVYGPSFAKQAILNVKQLIKRYR